MDARARDKGAARIQTKRGGLVLNTVLGEYTLDTEDNGMTRHVAADVRVHGVQVVCATIIKLLIVATIVSVAALGCSSGSYTTVTLGSDFDIPAATIAHGRSIEIEYSPHEVTALSPNLFALADSENVLVELHDMATSTAEELDISFGRGPQEVQRIGAVVPSNGGLAVLGLRRERCLLYDSDAKYVRTKTFDFPVIAMTDEYLIAGTVGGPYGPVEVRRVQSPSDVVFTLDVPKRLASDFALDTNDQALMNSRVVAVGGDLLVAAWRTFDIVGVLDLSTLTASWARIEDRRRPAVQSLTDRIAEQREPIHLISDIAIDPSGDEIYVARGSGQRDPNNNAVFQVDVYSRHMVPLRTVVLEGSGLIAEIAVSSSWVVVSSLAFRRVKAFSADDLR